MLVEAHPYNGLGIPIDTSMLVIGTAPPKRFSLPRSGQLRAGDVDFYYGSEDNQLWTEIFPKVYEDIALGLAENLCETRRQFLIHRKVWMHDICETYHRTKDNASDAGLKWSRLADLQNIFRMSPNVLTVVFTGGVAERLSGMRMEEQGLIPFGEFWKGMRQRAMPRTRRLTIKVSNEERPLVTHTLPSPSYANARVYGLQRKIEMYRGVFLRSASIRGAAV